MIDSLQLTDRNFILSQEGFFVPLKTHTYKVTEPPVEPGVFEIQKAGGRYVTVSGKVKKLDGMKCAIIMTNGTKIPIGDVQYIDGDMFRLFE